MIHRTLELYYDQLVIGSDLSALAYAYKNKCHLLYTKLEKPYRFNKWNNYKEQIKLWGELAFLLSYSSYMPFGNSILNLRVDDENRLKVIAKNNFIANIKFNKLIISDDSKIEGLPSPYANTLEESWVVDYFDVLCGSDHNIDFLTSSDSFVQKIYFYKSERDPVDNGKKDAVAVSQIKNKYLNSLDTSAAYARLKVIKMMKESGIVGRLNGFYKGRQMRRPLEVVSNRRLIYPLGKNKYNNLPNNIIMLYEDYKNILEKEEIKVDRIEMMKQLYGINR